MIMPYLTHYPSAKKPGVDMNIWILMRYKKLLWTNLRGDISRGCFFTEIKQTTQFMGNLLTSRNEMANSYTSLKASILLRKV